MFRVEVHKFIKKIILLFFRAGLWHQEEDEQTLRKWRLKIICSIYYCLLPISLATGNRHDDKKEFIFSVQSSMITFVLLVKMLHITWRKRETLDLLNRVCDFYVKDHENFTLINDKLKDLMKFAIVFFILVMCSATCSTLVIPLLESERTHFFNLGFPFDYENNEIAYWLAVAFLFTQVILTIISLLFCIIIWYLMINCGLTVQIKNMGEIRSVEEGKVNKRKITITERDNVFLRDLMDAITSHNELKEYECLRSSKF